ncbi:MAG: beta-1,6-glucan synthase [Proteobacteria bacterium]|nr:beta-1,6-glucan synthase [Pseudomonadota bacterium]
MPFKHPVWAALAFAHLVVLIALLAWLIAETKPVAIPGLELAQGEQLRCVSYAPFHRPGQTPFDEELIIPRQQIEEDLRAIKTITGCVRLYSTDKGLDQVPGIAQELGLKVLLGAWIGFVPKKSTLEIERAITLANAYRDTVRAIIVGNEVLLRHERTATEMRTLLDSVRARSPVPVTYADVWEFWLKNSELAAHVDFVTVHILPFWEDDPVDIGRALAHVAETRKKIGAAFPGKPILIGETGWPSAGLQRGESLPSKVNQARYIREFVRRAHDSGWDYNLIEAVDQPWKRSLEGTVGGYWGMLDANTLQTKFPLSGPVSERESIIAPLIGTGAGALLALLLALTGGFRTRMRLAALTLTGATTGLIAVLHAEHARLAYASLTDWVALGTVALAALAACAVLTRWPGKPLRPADIAWQRIRNAGLHFEASDLLSALRGFLLFAAAIAALLLLITSRYRDFPSLLYLTPATIFGVIGWLRGNTFSRPERICAALIAVCAIGRWLFEPANPQAIGWLLTCLALALPVLIRHRHDRRITPQQGKKPQQHPDGGVIGAVQHQPDHTGDPADPAA